MTRVLNAVAGRSAVLLYGLDRQVQAVHLRGVAERVEEVLQALQVVVQAEAAHVDDRYLVVRHGARLRLTGAAGRHEEVRYLRVGAAVAEVGAVDPDAAVAERRR